MYLLSVETAWENAMQSLCGEYLMAAGKGIEPLLMDLESTVLAVKRTSQENMLLISIRLF